MNKPYSFILIDDDQYSIEITEIQIKRLFANAHIASFSDPKEAILSIENDYLTYPEETIILLDINMPYSGWKVLEGFEGYPQEVHKRFTIYILSSSSDERDAERARLFPLVKACIEKPLTKETLLNIVEDSN